MIAQHAAPSSPPRDASDQVWHRPRTPIPPHRLAKLVNALGIPTPVPLSQEYNDSFQESRRSPTPSLASNPHLVPRSPTPSFQSKFLLHVVPPLNLPHDFDSSIDLTPLSASGYHTQFRRGVLVPLFPTLQGQLSAIAKEYALPSTAGIILYLVSAQSPNPLAETDSSISDVPGPRLSEDIWKHLWTHATKFELESYSRLATPATAGLGIVYGPHSSSLLPHDFSSIPTTLRPLISPARINPHSFVRPPTPTGSPASSNLSTNTPSESSQSELDTTDTSLPSDSRATTFDLPGLTSPSLVPVLAKLEFDIDKRKATWYGPWIRSRKLNHQKREQCSRAWTNASAQTLIDDSEAELPKVAPLPLTLVDRQAVPRFLLSADDEHDDHEADYLPFSESPPPDLEDSPSAAENRDSVTGTSRSNGDTGADFRANIMDQPEREINPNAARLASDELSLSESESTKSESEGGPMLGNDDENSHELNESPERPKLTLDIPPSSLDSTRRSSQTTLMPNTFRKAPPPPLIIVPKYDPIVSAEPSPQRSTTNASLAHDKVPSSSPEDINGMPGMRRVSTNNGKNNAPSEHKRSGTFFGDLDLGLDFEDSGEFDENDPNDRRRSQYVLKAKLDEIEKNLVQFSPRQLQHEVKLQDAPIKSPPLSSSSSVNGLTPRSAQSSSSSLASASRRSPLEQSVNGTYRFPSKPSPVWPAVPYSSLRRQDDGGETSPDFPPVPRLALNGVSNAIPVSPYKKSFLSSGDNESDESKARKQGSIEHGPMYPEIISPSFQKPASFGSPVIPLSPDPFGRFPSNHNTSSSSPLASNFPSQNSNVISQMDLPSPAPSSRFSIDSTDEGRNNRSSASINPVKSIKSLWRKGRKASMSFGSGSGSGTAIASPSGPSPSLPPVPSFSGSRSLGQSHSSQESVTTVALPPDKHTPNSPYHDTPLPPPHGNSSINSLIFDQESPYPVRVPRSSTTSRPRAGSQAPHRLRSISSAPHLVPGSERPPSLLTEADAMPPPLSADREKMGAPKSILKPRRVDIPTAPLSPRTRRSRAESMGRQSGGRKSPPSLFDASLLTANTRARQSRGPMHPKSSPDRDTFETADSISRLDPELHTHT